MTDRNGRAAGTDLPAGDDGHRASSSSRTRRTARSSRLAAKPSGRRSIGQLWTQAAVLSGPSVGRRKQRLRSDVDRRLRTWVPTFEEADRRHESDHRCARKRRTRTRPCRSPMDLVTSSASGIDPDISPEAAYYQAPRVAAARHLSVGTVNALIVRLSARARSWLSRRAARQRARSESRAGRAALKPQSYPSASSWTVGAGVNGRARTISSRAPASSKRRAKASRCGQRGRRCVPPTAIVVSGRVRAISSSRFGASSAARSSIHSALIARASSANSAIFAARRPCPAFRRRGDRKVDLETRRQAARAANQRDVVVARHDAEQQALERRAEMRSRVSARSASRSASSRSDDRFSMRKKFASAVSMRSGG